MSLFHSLTIDLFRLCRCAAAWCLVALLTACNSGAGENPASGFEILEAFPNLEFERPLFFGVPPDGSDRVFVLEQRGRVLWFENRSDIEQSGVEVALDITDKVRSPISDVRGNRGHNEEGLLGLAFHPGFEENGFVFLHYSATNPSGAEEGQRGVIARFRMDDDRKRIVPESEEVILEVDQFRGNHNGGMIGFGPDGYFYISFGDGGGAGDPRKHAQNLETLLGAILRVDVDNEEDGRLYSIPEDNPFAGRDDARGEIWAYGLRNVWRFSFDPETDDLWAGDVCQNAWEKIFLIRKGNNYGWPYLEGTHPHDGIPDHVDPDSLTPPIVEHPHSETRSITGGYVYHGSGHPDLQGAFIYGDFVTGAIFGLWYNREAGEVTRHQLLARAPAISSFGTDQSGELFIVSLSGSILKLAAAEADAAGSGSND